MWDHFVLYKGDVTRDDLQQRTLKRNEALQCWNNVVTFKTMLQQCCK